MYQKTLFEHEPFPLCSFPSSPFRFPHSSSPNFHRQKHSAHIILPISFIWTVLPAGALLFGFGLGHLYKNGSSSGGMDIAALILSK
ncbi:YitT family protein [Domibacillus epiphyticus]|uniref:YitT family protein n=1 Tax=Domibacillus epiphyticus TaxID=1714355 RepID=UPI0009FB343D